MKASPNNVVPFLERRDRPLTILIVEDSRIERAFLEEHVKQMGHEFRQAENGQQALNLLQHERGNIDVVLMDRMMPVMDGMAAVRAIKDDPLLRTIPVVMITAATSQEQMQEGLEAGVFYYLPKPVNENVLRSVLIAASHEAHQNRTLTDELKRHKTSFNLIHTCKFEYKTLEEVECLAAFMAHCFPDPERTLRGLAELLVNAVEHGNLAIGYERKSQIIDAGTWKAEIERRQAMPVYNTKHVEAVVTRKEEGVYAVITDQGDGFDWKKFLFIDPARAGDNHGRGIAQARATSFDKLTYNSIGNQVVAFVGHEKQLEW